MSSVGYLGEAGLYALDTCRTTNSTLWWDYYLTYAHADWRAVASLLPRNLVPNSAPPRAYQLNATTSLSWASQVRRSGASQQHHR
jgi:hypothetical protein